jgi:hypothetical protein
MTVLRKRNFLYLKFVGKTNKQYPATVKQRDVKRDLKLPFEGKSCENKVRCSLNKNARAQLKYANREGTANHQFTTQYVAAGVHKAYRAYVALIGSW